MFLWTLDSGTVTLDSGVFTWDGFAPATGAQVVLLPLQPISFRTRADMALYALATYTKHCAFHTRESYGRLIPESYRSMRGSLRV